MGSPGFSIKIDYRFAGNAFDDQAKQRIEEAARIWESFIADDFDDVIAGTTLDVVNPNTSQSESITLDEDIDDLIIFAGAQSLGDNGAAAFAGPVRTFNNATLEARYTGTDFEPAVGYITFNTDFSGFANIGLAIHEMGHILGIGGADIFDQLSTSGSFDGPTARAVNNGSPIPISSDEGHIDGSFVLDNGVRPVVGGGIGSGLPSQADLAILADIGYEIPALANATAGNLPVLNYTRLGTDGDDNPLFGFEGEDIILGGKGNDFIMGVDWDIANPDSDGADQLDGGSGNDTILGGGGNDLIVGGPGNDQLYGESFSASTSLVDRDTFAFGVNSGEDSIGDFEVDDDIIQVSPNYGFTSAAQLLNAVSFVANFTDGTSQSTLTLSTGNVITINHDKVLTAANFKIETLPTIDIFPEEVSPPNDTTENSGTSPNTSSNDNTSGGDNSSGGEDTSGGSNSSGDDNTSGGNTNETGANNGQPNRIKGSNKSDQLLGIDDVADIIVGGNGNDKVRGGTGGDRLKGGNGNDKLYGEGDDDILNGGAGKDRLFGGEGNDQLKGGGSNDRLDGGPGDDILKGGGGRDRFILQEGDGVDTIRGFRLNQDKLKFKGIRQRDLIFSQQGNQALISTTTDDLALFNGVQSTDLEALFG